MFGHHHHRGWHCGPGGRRGGWEQWAAQFAARFEEAQAGGGRRRMFDGGELRLVLLKLIADEPRHGYDLIRAIEDMTGGAYAPSPGVVYPTLTLLGEMGLIEEQASDGAKKRYAATAAGRAHLAEQAELVELLIARLTAVGEHRNRSDHRPLRRAMGNLREAVRGRVLQGVDSDQTVHQITAILDEAAQRIERL
jgi:DNA-binding PadR family transcriptional regulator